MIIISDKTTSLNGELVSSVIAGDEVIVVAEKKLIDADKPKLTVKQLQAIENAIDKTIRNYSFDDVDNYDCEMSMEYDNKVCVSHINFEAEAELADEIYKNVENLFGVVDEDNESNPSSE